jgi:hypothetical protein
MLIGKVTAHVESSRGMFVGGAPPTDDADDPLENLFELKIRDAETMDEPSRLVTDYVDIEIMNEWNSNGRIFIRQVDPIPLTILSISAAGLIPLRR